MDDVKDVKTGKVVPLKGWKNYFYKKYKGVVSTKGWLSLTDSRNLNMEPPQCTYRFHRSWMVQFENWQPHQDAAEEDAAEDDSAFFDAMEPPDAPPPDAELAQGPVCHELPKSELKNLKWNNQQHLMECIGCKRCIPTKSWYNHFCADRRPWIHKKGKYITDSASTLKWASKVDYYDVRDKGLLGQWACFHLFLGFRFPSSC